MSLNYVTLTLDLYDGQGNPVITGSASFTPSVQLTDATSHELIVQAPVPAVFHASGAPQVRLLATDNGTPLPAGWAWSVSFAGVPGSPAAFSFFLPYAGGASQNLSSLSPVSTAVTQYPANPMTTLGDIIYENATPAPARLAGNTAAAKKYLTQTGTGSASAAPAWSAFTAADVPGTLNGTTFDGNVVIDSGTFSATPLISSEDGTTTSHGAFVHVLGANNTEAGHYLLWYDVTDPAYLGLAMALGAGHTYNGHPIIALGGYYNGLGIQGSSSSGGNPIFGVLNSAQSGNGLNATAFTIYDNKTVVTFKNTLDDGSGNTALAGSLTLGNPLAVAQGGTGTTTQTPGIAPGFPVMLAPCKWAFANTDTGIGQKPLTSYTYANGTAGAGATVTHNSNGVLSVDGGSPQAGDRVLVLDPYANGTGAPPHPDGIYTVTSAGSASTPWVLTRATDCDTAAKLGQYWATTVTNGTLWAGAFAQVWNLDDQNGGALPFVTGTSFIGLGLSAYTSTALGGGSTAYGGGIAIGPNATATAVLARAVGDTAQAAATYAHAYGPYSVVNSQFGVSLGYQSYVNGIQATGVGDDCNAYGPGMVAFASGRDNTHGDAQGCLQYLNGDTTDGTQTTITGASGQQLHFLDYQGNAAYNKTLWLTFTVIARRFGTVGDYAVFTASGALHGDGSSSYAWNGGTPPSFTTAASGGTITSWAVAASVATNVLSVKVTGAAAKSISWNCEIRTVEMAH